jgi:hypothetical protein
MHLEPPYWIQVSPHLRAGDTLPLTKKFCGIHCAGSWPGIMQREIILVGN